MKKRCFASLTAFFLVACLCLPVFAHSGRTDASGGHRDNKNKSGLGSYHYHCGGYPAHLHPDGVCPYDSGYDDSEPEEVQVSSVSVSCEKQELLPGETVSARSEIYPSDAENGKTLWLSSDEKVATVDSDGTIHALSPGTAVITASTSNGSSDSFELTVKEVAVTAISISSSEKTVFAGDSFLLSAAVTPENATDPAISWACETPDIASVDSKGKVTAKKPGTAVFKAASGNGVTASFSITIQEVLPQEISVDSDIPENFVKGDSSQLHFSVLPANASNQTVSFSSSRKDIVSVDKNGTITAHAPGKSTVTLTCGEIRKEIVVEVKPILPDSVQIQNMETRLKVGDELLLEASVSPENADEKAVQWRVDNESLATVDNGKLTALKSGTVTVTAVVSGGLEDSVPIELYSEIPAPLVLSLGTLLVIGCGVGGYFLMKKWMHPQK